MGDYHRCGSLSYVGGKSQYSVDCGGAVGSSIKITGKANYLTLCEVQAFGTRKSPFIIIFSIFKIPIYL